MIHADFEARCHLFGKREGQIREAIEKSAYKKELEFLYTAMPLSDAANYDPQVFENYAAHGHYLRENVEWCKELSEEMYLNEVLCHRINDEEISDCRKVFYDAICPLVAGKSVEEAIKIINYWCLEEATYKLTDERTASPLTVLRCAFGRCGEESTFAVTALRSVGIPARQIYSPKWPHCDDNHAWVEVYCNGDWHYIGACEPEETMDRGWFTAAASRAMLIHARTFGNVPMEEELISKDGCMTMWNQLPRYADSTELTVKVTKDGQPVEGVLIKCELLNYAEFAPISRQLTDAAGEIHVTVGYGDLHIHCAKDGLFVIKKIDIKEQQEVAIDWNEAVAYEEDCYNVDFEMQPPQDNMQFIKPQAEEVKLLRQQKFDAAVAKRHAKEAGYVNKVNAHAMMLEKGYTEEQATRAALILASTYGNENEILDFIEREDADLRLALLEAMTKKDWADLKASILEECMELALPYCGQYPEDVFVKGLLNPRIGLEILSDWRGKLPKLFSEELQEQFRANPKLVGSWIRENIVEHPEEEHRVLFTNPMGLLEVGSGDDKSCDILFVAICRSLGIPARLAPDDHSPQYWDAEKAQYIEGMPKEEGHRVPFTILSAEEEPWIYSQTWSLARLENGEYMTLDLSGEEWTEKQLELMLQEGHYRLITCKRMPTGALFAKEYRFAIKDGGENTITIHQRQAKLIDLLSDKPIPNFTLYEADGTPVSMEEYCAGRANLLLWLEQGKEPTEHILNEMIDLKREFVELDANVIFILNGPEALKDARIHRALKNIPGIKVLYDDFRDTMSAMARRMYIDPEKLPIVVLCSHDLNGIYGSSGYNVGLGDLILQLFAELE